MELPILLPWKKIWDEWNIRGFIILSLSLQTLLIVFAPLRKRTASNWIIMPLWSAYLLAEWVAGFAIGLISSSEGTGLEGPINNNDLLAFWAPFLLVHLGGRDTITAFSLMDNELWLRNLVNLIIHCLAAAYVLVQSMPNKLLVPTILMFLTGIIKYSERTRALYLATMDSFRDSMLTEHEPDPDPGPNYAKFMDEYFAKKEANLPVQIVMIPEPDRITMPVVTGKLTHLEVVLHAYRFFETFKGLIVDVTLSMSDRNESRDLFLERNAKDGFSVVEVELNFIYDVLYTKASVVHCLAGHISRTMSFISVVVALCLFSSVSKIGLDKRNVKITYTLLYGSIALDIIALLGLLFSDWTAIALKKSPQQLKPRDKSYSTKFINFILSVKNQTWSKDSTNPLLCCLGSPMKVISRRWCESVSQFNFIYYCLHQRSKGNERIIGYLGLSDFLDELKYVRNEPFTEGLRSFIYEELLIKSKMAADLDTAKKICAARGEWILRVEGCSFLLDNIEEVDYDESLLLWHIATELCYNHDKKANVNSGEGHNGNSAYCTFAKILSDYMLYLLVLQFTRMSAVAGIWEIRFRDTKAEAIKFFRDAKLGQGMDKNDHEKEQQEACKRILSVHTLVKPVEVKGDRCKSVLFDACILAKKLIEMKDKDKWMIMSKVWVELLSYAASHCRTITYAQQLSKGGELLTLVWLLLANFGLGHQYQISGQHARAKLIVG